MFWEVWERVARAFHDSIRFNLVLLAVFCKGSRPLQEVRSSASHLRGGPIAEVHVCFSGVVWHGTNWERATLVFIGPLRCKMKQRCSREVLHV
jgi:hypothetical protein